MTGIFLGHSGENEHLSSIRIIPGTRLGTRVTPRSQLPPNKGDRSSAYKLKEKLDMYQARHEMGLGPKMICFQRIVELELVWDMNCSFFDTHTHNHWWFERVGFVWCTLKVAFRWAEDDTSIPETSTACSLFGSNPLEQGSRMTWCGQISSQSWVRSMQNGEDVRFMCFWKSFVRIAVINLSGSAEQDAIIVASPFWSFLVWISPCITDRQVKRRLVLFLGEEQFSVNGWFACCFPAVGVLSKQTRPAKHHVSWKAQRWVLRWDDQDDSRLEDLENFTIHGWLTCVISVHQTTCIIYKYI